MNVGFVLIDGDITGGQVVAHELMRACREAGHEVTAWFPVDGPMVERVRADGLAVEITPLRSAFRVDDALRLARRLRARKVDVLNTHTLFAGNQLARIAATVARVPVISHAHVAEQYHGKPRLAALQQALDRATTRRCAAVVSVSYELSEALIEQGMAGSSLEVIHNGVRIEPWEPRPAAAELHVACVARLAPVKGQHVLVEALALAGPGIRATLVGAELESGGASYRDQLEQRAAELGLSDRIELLGFREDARALIAAADALVLPSFREGLPIVVLEAMERGRPVVATAVGGTPEAVLDGETGLLVPAGDVEALAAALVRLRDDPALRVRLGAAGRARVESEFSLAAMCSRTLALYAHATR